MPAPFALSFYGIFPAYVHSVTTVTAAGIAGRNDDRARGSEHLDFSY
jgi:hypothetical protein